MQGLDFTPFIVSLKLALITTIVLFFVVLPFAWNLSQSKSRFKPLIQSICALPLVLPPTVMGFYILFAFSKNSLIGGFLYEHFGIQLVFTFWGLVFAIIFKFLDGIISAKIEDNEKNVQLYLERNNAEHSQSGEQP